MSKVSLSELQAAFLDMANAIKARELESTEAAYQARLRVLVDSLNDVPDGAVGDFVREGSTTLFVPKET